MVEEETAPATPPPPAPPPVSKNGHHPPPPPPAPPPSNDAAPENDAEPEPEAAARDAELDGDVTVFLDLPIGRSDPRYDLEIASIDARGSSLRFKPTRMTLRMPADEYMGFAIGPGGRPTHVFMAWADREGQAHVTVGHYAMQGLRVGARVLLIRAKRLGPDVVERIPSWVPLDAADPSVPLPRITSEPFLLTVGMRSETSFAAIRASAPVKR